MFVAITHNLKNTVRSHIRSLRAIEARAEKAPESPVLDGTEPWGAASLWGPVYDNITPELKATLTCKRPQPLQFLIKGDLVDSDGDATEAMVVNLPSPGVPRLFYVDENGDRSYGNPQMDVTTETHPHFAAYVAHMATMGEINKRWRKVEHDIVGFLEAAKSLNEALKLWPDIARYVDQELLDKVAEKTAAKPKAAQSAAMEKLAKMDLDAITSSHVLTRLIDSSSSKE